MCPSIFATLTRHSEPTSAPLQPDALKHRIDAVCRGVVSEVRVTALPDHRLKVRLTVENAAQEKTAAEKVLPLPEMNDPNVMVEFLVAPRSVR